MFEEVKAEARDAITRLASHPSLVLWCGGNENVEGFQHWGWKEQLDGKAWGSTFYYETLPQILNELDGTRPYIPTSPFSTLVEDVKDFSSGTNHIWDVWNERGYQRYEDYAPSFSAEFGYNGPGSWLTLTKSIKKDNLDSTDADLANHQKAFDGMAKLAAGLKREFTNEFTQGPKWYFAAQLVQARAVEVGLKHFRSQYESCSGTMLWQYNDMWPAISWSVIDSSGARKLSWFAMREAYRPRFLHFSGEQRDLYIINDTSNNWKDKLTFYLLDQLGKLVTKKEIEVELSARSQQKYSLNELAPGIGTADLDGFVIAQLGNIRVTRRLRNSPVVKVNPPNYEISSKSVGSQLKIKLLAHDFLTEFSLLPELLAENLTMVSNQNITLLPGESCELEIEFHNEKDCEKIKNNLDQICFSLNHLMN
jgi:beta-mannosidase